MNHHQQSSSLNNQSNNNEDYHHHSETRLNETQGSPSREQNHTNTSFSIDTHKHNHHYRSTTTYQLGLGAPSLSRFLSHSFVNPLYKSRYFSSSVSENPLFYSTQEGYETNEVRGEDDGILPNEDDDRLKNDEDHNPHPNTPLDIHSNNDTPHIQQHHQRQSTYEYQPSSSGHAKRKAEGRLEEDQNESEGVQHDNEDDDSDPFYVSEQQHHHHHQNPSDPTGLLVGVPRDIMASRALSNLMVSQLTIGNQSYLHPAATMVNEQAGYHHHSSNYSHQTGHHPTSIPGGWKMYHTLNLTDDGTKEGPAQQGSSKPKPSQLTQSRRLDGIQQSAHPDLNSQSNHTAVLPPHRPRLPASNAHPKHSRRQAEVGPYSDDDPVNISITGHEPLVDSPPPPPAASALPLPTFYIYPTEARDIGPDVVGRPVLGPQTYRDSFWMAAWLGSLVYVFLQSAWMWMISRYSTIDSPTKGDDDQKSGLMVTLPVLALLITFTFGFCLVSLGFLVMVKRSIKFLVYGTMIGVPSVLGLIGLWTWSESVSVKNEEGQGILSLISVFLSALIARLIWSQRAKIDRTIKVLELSIGVIIEHPSLVLVTIGLTMTSILISLPFITLVYFFILNGKYDEEDSTEWTIKSESITQALLTAFIWSWTLNVIKNLQRIIIAGVVSHWYFNRHSPPGVNHKKYTSIESTYDSISRAIGPSLGTVCLSSFLLTIFDILRKIIQTMKDLGERGKEGIIGYIIYGNQMIRMIWNGIGGTMMMIGIGIGIKLIDSLNSFCLVYCGITGFKFYESLKKIRYLINRNGQIHLINS